MSVQTKKKAALGKGLGALLGDDTVSKVASGRELGSISMIPLSTIEVNPFNPRSDFDQESLKELSLSISVHGIIQPLTVRKLSEHKYQIISGERRFRASQLSGLKEVPAYIRTANDQTMLEMALVENIQRQDLNAIEIALSYQRLIDECNITQDQLSQKVAKSRSSITNFLRLLKLPAEIQAGVRDNNISMGHARALVSAGDEEKQVHLYQQIIEHGLSVRDTEELVKGELQIEEQPNEPVSIQRSKPIQLSSIQSTFRDRLGELLATKVQIKKQGNGAGSIVLKFSSENDLNRIVELLSK